MAVLLSEIQWGDPVLPAAHDVEWEAELKLRGAQVLEVDRRVAPSRWLREAAYEATTMCRLPCRSGSTAWATW